MPALVRKLLVLAAIEGLVLQPLAQRHQRPTTPILIEYKTHKIKPLTKAIDNSENAFVESHGIVGLLTVASASFFVSISQRQQVAQIRGFPVYIVTDVALIPLSSQADAEHAIVQTKDGLKHADAVASDESVVTDSSGDEESSRSVADDDPHIDDQVNAVVSESLSPEAHTKPPAHQRRSSVAEDVIGRKGAYGRFADNWFSKQGWSVEKRRLQGMSIDNLHQGPNAATIDGDSSIIDGLDGQGSSRHTVDTSTTDAEKITLSLLPKLLRTTKMLFSSRNFFFSYDLDITRSIAGQQDKPRELPLNERVDPLYFWNRHLSLPFIEASLDTLVLPLMQGFVGQQAFSIEKTPGPAQYSVKDGPGDVSEIIEMQEHISESSQGSEEKASKGNFLLTLISRRSVHRAGLRYLRRGIDDQGYTANSVETEQILSSPTWDSDRPVYSFVQFRGSIPLYFSQTPYSFKPVPVLQHSFDTNHTAFTEHFRKLKSTYGKVQLISLVEKQNNEAQIGEEYQKHAEQLQASGDLLGKNIGFEWFDFHHVCRGMKFENVSLLIDSQQENMKEFSETILRDGKLEQTQKGVFRTNCMDCLDRTNVVQSAFGRRALEAQLENEGFDLSIQAPNSTQWLDYIWADNGDAISKQYSSTAALKGDFTRTRKRDYRGILNDLNLTLNRYFNNIVNDYFSQATIDYLLGNVSSQTFAEFEADMMSKDPAMSMKRVRQNAIDTASRIVIADSSEDLLGGWTLSMPDKENTIRTFPFKEAILLLTDAGLYICQYSWDEEKVSSFERIDLADVLGMNYGAYITSTLAPSQSNESRNVGFVLRYKPGETIQRVNTRSLATSVPKDAEKKSAKGSSTSATSSSEPHILAFKALPSQSPLEGSAQADSTAVPELELIRSICTEIESAAIARSRIGPAHVDGKIDFVTEKDVISLKDAKRSTGIFEQLGHEIKKLVWA